MGCAGDGAAEDIATYVDRMLFPCPDRADLCSGQSASAGDKAIEDIMLALGRLDELRGERRDARSKLRKVEKLTPNEASEAQARLCEADDEIRRTESSIESMRAALGARAAQRWDALRGYAYLRARINARRQRAVIRASLQSHKFEREKLERSFRRHVMRTLLIPGAYVDG